MKFSVHQGNHSLVIQNTFPLNSDRLRRFCCSISSWVLPYIRFTKDGCFSCVLSLRLLNTYLPYGANPVGYVCDMFVDAFASSIPSFVY